MRGDNDRADRKRAQVVRAFANKPLAPHMSTHAGRATKIWSFNGMVLLSSKSMVVPDSIFDALVFGVLLLALLLDNVFPFSPLLHGAASLLAVGAAAYFAAQELSDALQRRGWWSQESLSTSLALSVAGFIYYFWRNASDTALFALSVVLMMTALMILISLLTAFGEAWSARTARPVAGLALTVVASLALGALSGLLILLLSSPASLATKAVVVAVGAVLWKLRETLRPPARNTVNNAPNADAPNADAINANAPNIRATGISQARTRTSTEAATAAARGVAPNDSDSPRAALVPRRALMPQRGTLLDRLVPVLVLSALLFVGLQQAGFSFK